MADDLNSAPKPIRPILSQADRDAAKHRRQDVREQTSSGFYGKAQRHKEDMEAANETNTPAEFEDDEESSEPLQPGEAPRKRGRQPLTVMSPHLFQEVVASGEIKPASGKIMAVSLEGVDLGEVVLKKGYVLPKGTFYLIRTPKVLKAKVEDDAANNHEVPDTEQPAGDEGASECNDCDRPENETRQTKMDSGSRDGGDCSE